MTSDNAPTRRADFDDLQTLSGLTAGRKMFGRYILEAEVGRGGMGVVWCAQDVELEERVALKFLPDVVARDEAAVDELKAETRHARRLTHANIVRIHQFERDGTVAAVSMEFVDGVALSKLRLAQPARVFSVATLKPLLGQLCAALEYAHAQAKVVHRDLKPANLLVTNEGQLKVTDFGIARSLSDTHTRLTGREADSSGTLAYMSPQQLLGTKPTVTDDIYALGATLYELLTGKPPFFTGDIATQVRTVNPPSLAARRTELDIVAEPIPYAWEQVILACLAKRPEDRPQSAGEVARRIGLGPDLASAPAGEAPVADDGDTVPAGKVLAGSPPASVGATRPVWSRQRAFLLGAVGLVGLIGLVCLLWRSCAPRRSRTIASAPAMPTRVAIPGEKAKPAPATPSPVVTPLEEVKPPPAPAAGAIMVQTNTEMAAADVRDKEAPRTREIKVTSAPEKSPYPQPGQPWVNTLGMKFASVPGAGVLFAVWDTRVQDFEAFVKESGYDATGGMYSLGSDGWKQRGNTWRSPGFPQGGTHPVCGVSWNDAKAFCAWLTEKERREGRLGPDQEYRLPTDAEWSVAAGLDEPRGGTPQSKSLGIKSVYPWGPQWPPPSGAGNYAGREARDRAWPSDWSVIDAYGDGYSRTSPVGSFTANRFGLYDMGGNVWQWCEDCFNGSSGSRVLRGGSFASNLAGDLLSSNRNISDPDKRYDFDGFRCVLVAVVQDGRDH